MNTYEIHMKINCTKIYIRIKKNNITFYFKRFQTHTFTYMWIIFTVIYIGMDSILIFCLYTIIIHWLSVRYAERNYLNKATCNYNNFKVYCICENSTGSTIDK